MSPKGKRIFKRKAESLPLTMVKKANKTQDTFNVATKDKDGNPINVILVPTRNKFDALADKSDEVIMSNVTTLKKPRIPPITVFNTQQEHVKQGLVDAGVQKFQIKLLRHGLHVYCETSEDFKNSTYIILSKKCATLQS